MAFTFFFRDRQTLDLIVEEIMPRIGIRKFINIWDAGCAYGAEPYTLAILLRENIGDFLFKNVKIFATDIDESSHFGEVIKDGIYKNENLISVPPPMLAKYFTKISPDSYQIIPDLRSKLEFYLHDLLSFNPVKTGFCLIICKNVLLHFNAQQRIKVIKMFHESLDVGGFLAMEHTQKLPDELSSYFKNITPSAQIFQKIG